MPKDKKCRIVGCEESQFTNEMCEGHFAVLVAHSVRMCTGLVLGSFAVPVIRAIAKTMVNDQIFVQRMQEYGEAIKENDDDKETSRNTGGND